MRRLLLVLLASLAAGAAAAAEPRDAGRRLPDFRLTERSGRTVSLSDLAGRYWVADFVFTRCQGPCPLLSSHMADLQRRLPADVRLVTFTVDPGYDTPEVLAKYADRYRADPDRWWFLTGKKREIYEVLRQGFRIGAEENAEAAGAGDAFIHSTLFFLVDGKGRVRGMYHGDDPDDLKQIVTDERFMSLRDRHPLIARLPKVDALLNGLSFGFLMLGYLFIRSKEMEKHKACMLSAFAASMLFLAGYLTYHAFAGSKPFPGQGAARPVYFTILITHSILAAVVPPLAIWAISRAWKGEYDRHVRVVRWTFPLWVYVSVTGVVIYAMLYHWPA